ncbi:hypothetical protein QFZ67_004495 [Streptomyces sp. V1I1]|nr:hypothetical protein [Streptomyces sp. V1I1]
MWSHLNRSLTNLTKQDLDRLTALVKTCLEHVTARP